MGVGAEEEERVRAWLSWSTVINNISNEEEDKASRRQDAIEPNLSFMMLCVVVCVVASRHSLNMISNKNNRADLSKILIICNFFFYTKFYAISYRYVGKPYHKRPIFQNHS